MNACRKPEGGRIERNKPVSFHFDAKAYTGFKGDTLASALLANGVHFVGRSYKYHRPRGIMSAGAEEAGALLGIDRGKGRFDSNTRATTQELFDGLKAQSQHCWPSLRWDVGEVNDLASPLLSAGFYYKTFMWPKSFWDKLYEPIIRKSAGLGKAPLDVDPDSYASRYAHCDILILGGGPAGLAAALAASKSGAKIILADEQPEIGGALLSDLTSLVNGSDCSSWLASATSELMANENITILTRTTAFGYYHQNFIGLGERLSDHLASPATDFPRERLWRVRAKEVILATGAIERPLVFSGNDRPGIMLAGAARTYLNRYGVICGKRPVVVTSHDSAYPAAFDLAAAGVDIAAIIDIRTSITSSLQDRAGELGIEVLSGHAITGTRGRLRISAVFSAPAGTTGKPRRIDCDALLMCGGWTPSVHLFSQSRGRLSWNEDIGAYIPGEYVQNARSAGACDGRFLLSDALNGGAAAGQHAAIEAGFNSDNPGVCEVVEEAAISGISVGELTGSANRDRIRAFVDYQNDVTAKDIRLAVREGFHSIEHIKRYTASGMATDQGKTSNLNALAIASDALERPVPDIGLTTFRPPYTPTSFGVLAGYSRGELFDVMRKTPIDKWARRHGAVFEPVSLWRRARYFPREGEDMHKAVARECKATRVSVGISDASTLGKIEVAGKDAAEFLNRIYTNSWTKLGTGRCRYGLMLGEDGYIFDDGVVGRVATGRFHVTTTTGGAARVFAHMEDYLQTEWPDLEVWLTSTTEQWAVIALNGPNARKLIEPFVEGIDLDKDAFPHMAIREGKIFGVPTRLFRVSFTGELGFEINVPSNYGLAVWEHLIEAGEKYNIVPYGTETLHVLRAEKGYIIVGQETDGTQTPDDVGMTWAVGRQKTDFVGKRSLERPDICAPGRKQLVGLLTGNPETVLDEGAQIIAEETTVPPVKMIGHVTSAYWSETLHRSIALAVIENGRAQIGNRFFVPMPDRVHLVEIVKPVFYDPEGERLNV